MHVRVDIGGVGMLLQGDGDGDQHSEHVEGPGANPWDLAALRSRYGPDGTGRRPRDRQGGAYALTAHSAHVPKISSVCETSAKPCSAATRSAQLSTVGPATSTVRPHTRPTRW